MKRHSIAGVLSLFVLLAGTGCSERVDEDFEGSDDALNELPTTTAAGGRAPHLLDIETSTPRLRAILEQDWSQAQVDVLDLKLDRPSWYVAEKDEAPTFVPEITYETSDERESAGKCRWRVGTKKVIVKCRWRF
jgi:hypothetical protein